VIYTDVVTEAPLTGPGEEFGELRLVRHCAGATSNFQSKEYAVRILTKCNHFSRWRALADAFALWIAPPRAQIAAGG